MPLSRAVALYDGNQDGNPPIIDPSISSSLGFPPILPSTKAKITATAAHFAEVRGSLGTRVAMVVPTLCSSMVSPLLKLGFLTVILDKCFISYGG